MRMNYHQRQPHAPWRLDGDKSGGIVFEWEVHEIDFVRTIGGEVSRVYAQTAYTRQDAPNFVDHFTAILTFQNGGYGNLEASQSCWLGQNGRGFIGTAGAAQTEGPDGVRIRTADMDEPEVIKVEVGGHVERKLGKLTQDADFIRAIRDDDVSPVAGPDGRANVEIGLAILESGRTGAAVTLPMA